VWSLLRLFSLKQTNLYADAEAPLRPGWPRCSCLQGRDGAHAPRGLEGTDQRGAFFGSFHYTDRPLDFCEGLNEVDRKCLGIASRVSPHLLGRGPSRRAGVAGRPP
jgi:hypothetical protein